MKVLTFVFLSLVWLLTMMPIFVSVRGRFCLMKIYDIFFPKKKNLKKLVGLVDLLVKVSHEFEHL